MHPYGAYPPYGAPNPYATAGAPAAYGRPAAAVAAYPPQALAYAPAAAYGGAYPSAPAYYNQTPAGYHAAVPAPIAIAPIAVVEEAPAVVEAPPLSPISAARAKEAAMIALSLEQAARPPPPAAVVAASSTTTAAAAAADDDAPQRDPNELEMKLENAHYNLPEVLGLNLVAHPYYRDLSSLSSVEEVVDEIYAQVKHVEPMVAGKDRLPSTALFLLYKLFTMGVTKRQMNELLRHKDSPYIRALGFLFLRCVYDPKGLWGWFEPFLSDQSVFVPGQQDKTPITMSAFIRELLEKNEYYGMKLRRIPIPVQRDYQLKLLALDARVKRGSKNEPYRKYLVKGVRLQAEYFSDSKFYDAAIDRAMEPLESGNFIVTFLGFGNQEEVDIGALKIPNDIVERAEHDAREASRGRPILKERGAPPIESSASHRSTESSRPVPSSSRDRDADRHRDSRERDSRSSSHRDRDSHRSKRSSRSRSRSRDRHRSHRSGDRSRDRSRDRSSRDRERHHRRSSRSRSRSHSPASRGGDVFSDLPSTGGHSSSYYAGSSSSSSRHRARSPSPEVSLDALLRKERELSVAQGKDYARRPTSFKDSLSMSLLTGTTRKRSRTPPPVRRAEGLAPIDESAAAAPKPKSTLTDEQKAARQAILSKYGDAGSARPAPSKKRSANDDDDIIRLGM